MTMPHSLAVHLFVTIATTTTAAAGIPSVAQVVMVVGIRGKAEVIVPVVISVLVMTTEVARFPVGLLIPAVDVFVAAGVVVRRASVIIAVVVGQIVTVVISGAVRVIAGGVAAVEVV